MSNEPFVYVSTKDGMFAGAVSASCGVPSKEKSWKKEVAKFCGDHIVEGFSITTVYSREEYEALIKGMSIWQSEAAKKAVAEPDLFQSVAGGGI